MPLVSILFLFPNRSINHLVPDATPYSFTPGDRPNQVQMIGDLYRELSPDLSYQFGEFLDESLVDETTRQQLLQAMEQTTVNTTISEDEQGRSSVFIAGPIRKADGQPVGVLALDYNADFVRKVQHDIRYATAIACIIALVWLSFSSTVILKATQRR